MPDIHLLATQVVSKSQSFLQKCLAGDKTFKTRQFTLNDLGHRIDDGRVSMSLREPSSFKRIWPSPSVRLALR